MTIVAIRRRDARRSRPSRGVHARPVLGAWALVVAALALCLALVAPAGAATLSRAPLHLALRFQPHLLFDSAERWRPVDVDALLAEPGHRACPPPASGQPCAPLTSPAQLTSGIAYLDLRGTRLDGVDAAAPDVATCARSSPRLLDCDEGGRSPIYARVMVGKRLIAIDYWWFARYNAFLVDLHEGDWEGVTVIVDRAGRRVRGVNFAAHSDVWRYDADVPELEGRHVRVYVARGSHAAYPRACRRATCAQTGRALPEARFDGASPWVANDRSVCRRSCVRLLPLAAAGAPASWDAWDGRWGAPLLPLFPPPRTPAFQARYASPFSAARSHRHRF